MYVEKQLLLLALLHGALRQAAPWVVRIPIDIHLIYFLYIIQALRTV